MENYSEISELEALSRDYSETPRRILFVLGSGDGPASEVFQRAAKQRNTSINPQHLHRHGLQVRENLNLCEFKTVRCSCAGSDGNDVRQEWMGQGLVERVIRAQARWLML